MWRVCCASACSQKARARTQQTCYAFVNTTDTSLKICLTTKHHSPLKVPSMKGEFLPEDSFKLGMCDVSIVQVRAHKKYKRCMSSTSVIHVLQSTDKAFLSLNFFLFFRRRKVVFGISFARDVACLLRERVLTKSTSANATDMLRVRQATDRHFCL